jgi:hypothetical protein
VWRDLIQNKLAGLSLLLRRQPQDYLHMLENFALRQFKGEEVLTFFIKLDHALIQSSLLIM